MYWWQSDEQMQQEIKETCEAIKRYSEKLLSQGPEACRKYLIDVDIIREEEE